MRNKIFTAMGSLLLILLAVSVMPALAQETTEEAVAPATLLEALDLDVCEDYIGAAQIAASGSAGDDTTVAPIVPEGAETHSVLVFDLSAVAHGDVMTLLRFESKDSVAAKAEELPLVALDALDADADASLFGWIVIYFDADGNALCRSTGYPAVSGDEAPLEIVSLQGFIAQLVSETQLDAGNFQPGEFCTFETPQYCDAIFIGDARDELIDQFVTQPVDIHRAPGSKMQQGFATLRRTKQSPGTARHGFLRQADHM